MKGILLKIFYFLIILELFFNALFRYVIVSIAGIEQLAYIVKVIMVVLIFLKLRKLKFENKDRLIIILVLTVLLMSVVSSNFLQTVFALFIVLPFFFFICYVKEFYSFIVNNERIIIFLFLISWSGIVYDYYYDFPWKELNVFSIGDYELSIAVDWTTLEKERVAGFFRSSFDAAIGLLFLMIIIISRIKNLILSNMIFLITFIGINITTTKGVLISLLLIYLIYILKIFSSKSFSKIIIKVIIWVCLLILILLPVLQFNLSIPYLNNKSLIDRLSNTWPSAFKFLKEPSDFIYGAGIGAVGLPQKFFGTPALYNPGDNFFVFTYINYGFLSFVIIIGIMVRFYRYNSKNVFLTYLTVFIFSYGITTNLMESSICLLMISFVLFNCYEGIQKNVKKNKSLKSTSIV